MEDNYVSYGRSKCFVATTTKITTTTTKHFIPSKWG
jgi:hypothetical protein